MYWSGVQSTGAEIKKYFTDDLLVLQCARAEEGDAHGCRLVGELLEHLVASSVGPRCSA